MTSLVVYVLSRLQVSPYKRSNGSIDWCADRSAQASSSKFDLPPTPTPLPSQGCWSCLEPLLPEETKEQVERRQMVERGANFTKRSFTLGGFALRSQVGVGDVRGCGLRIVVIHD